MAVRYCDTRSVVRRPRSSVSLLTTDLRLSFSVLLRVSAVATEIEPPGRDQFEDVQFGAGISRSFVSCDRSSAGTDAAKGKVTRVCSGLT